MQMSTLTVQNSTALQHSCIPHEQEKNKIKKSRSSKSLQLNEKGSCKNVWALAG